MRKTGIILGFITALLAVTFTAFWTPDSDVAEMQAKYGGPDPMFAATAIDAFLNETKDKNET